LSQYRATEAMLWMFRSSSIYLMNWIPHVVVSIYLMNWIPHVVVARDMYSASDDDIDKHMKILRSSSVDYLNTY